MDEETRMKAQDRHDTEARIGHGAQNIMIKVMEMASNPPLKVAELKPLARIAREAAEVLHKPAAENTE